MSTVRAFVRNFIKSSKPQTIKNQVRPESHHDFWHEVAESLQAEFDRLERQQLAVR